MKKNYFLALAFAFALSTSIFSGCAAEEKTSVNPDETLITLSGSSFSAEYGDNITEIGSVEGSYDIIYYEDLDTYESGNPYGEGTADERHSAEKAAANTVVNIKKAGTYRLTGTLDKGQIRVDLGEEAKTDPNAKVTLILDNADITCDVAPAILFLNVYECDNDWSAETATETVDTTEAGANIIIADGSTNNINGSHVARIYKDNTEEKKLWKQDGAFYSYMSMNVDGETADDGILNIIADNEGLDSELHLTLNGGNINIYSQNDGINTNEDGVSVTTINGGNLHIIAGLGAEGDGIDSNGWLVINGGTVVASANPAADAGLDSDMGSYINGGNVIALGSTMDWAESDSAQVTMNLRFAEYKASDSAVIVTKDDGSVVFAYDPSEDEVLGQNVRKYMGAVISSPNLSLGETYNVYIGGTVNGEENAGVYDVSTITDFTDTYIQEYTGTDVGGFMGGRPGFGGGRPDGMEFADGEMPQPPNGMEFNEGERPELPEGMEMPTGERPEKPNDMKFEEGEMPQLPEGMEMPDFNKTNGEINELDEPSTTFFMQDKVNNFSGLKNKTE